MRDMTAPTERVICVADLSTKPLYPVGHFHSGYPFSLKPLENVLNHLFSVSDP